MFDYIILDIVIIRDLQFQNYSLEIISWNKKFILTNVFSSYQARRKTDIKMVVFDNS